MTTQKFIQMAIYRQLTREREMHYVTYRHHMCPNLVWTSNYLGGLNLTQACVLQQLTPLALFLSEPIVNFYPSGY